ncbi:response regulator, partial [bacterium]|nr:response regulator [bacterium]
VQESAETLLSLINDLLDFSKIEAGKLDLDPMEFQLRDLMDSTLNTLALRAHQKELELAGQVKPEVPDFLVGDPLRLRQVLVNLIGNAIKFTDHGEVVVLVEQESASDDGVVLHFAVSDTGLGIPRDKQQAIFEAFAQADGSTTRRYGGTGLGLSISQQLVKMMGGTMWVESEPSRGSTFHFSIQFGQPQAVPVTEEPLPLDRLRDLPVLVVDDNRTNRRILHDVVANWGMRPVLAEQGLEAIALLQQAAANGQPFPVVLLDYMMPGLDGAAVALQIRSNPALANPAVIMLSSATAGGAAARCRELGLSAYLTKPVKQAEVLRAVLAAVGGLPHSDTTAVAADPARRAVACRRLRLLLAEDNVVNQKLAVRLLERHGHQVVVAVNGHQAVEFLERENVDAVLMDVQMPELDGLEATALIRERERARGGHLPIIAMTAHAMAGDRERCLAAGMDGYVPKPLEITKLLQVLQELAGTPAAGGRSASDAAEMTGASDPAGAPFDRAAALAQMGGDEGLFQEVVLVFQQEAPAMLEEIRAAASQGDAVHLERAAHKLKGAVGFLQARPVQQLLQQLEQAGATRQVSGVNQLTAELVREIQRLEAVLGVAPTKETAPCKS